MDRLIYTAMSGASAAAQRQAVVANNLANASTQGFRAELVAQRAAPLQGEGLPTRVMTAETTPGWSETPGAAQATGRGLDVMARGRAMFAVQALDGTEAYTRAGALQVLPDGTLAGPSGLPMLSDGGAPLTAPANAELRIASDGLVTAQARGQAAIPVGRLKMATPETATELQRGPDGLFRTAEGDPLPQDPAARLDSGTLEASNVNPVADMVAMIAASRHFETQLKLIQSADTNDRAASRLLGPVNA